MGVLSGGALFLMQLQQTSGLGAGTSRFEYDGRWRSSCNERSHRDVPVGDVGAGGPGGLAAVGVVDSDVGLVVLLVSLGKLLNGSTMPDSAGFLHITVVGLLAPVGVSDHVGGVLLESLLVNGIM